jgi:putative NIF3 family GTP cyclohydrolase 1 type 2
MTAREIVERIKQQLADAGVGWRAETVDTFKAGNPDVDVTAVATMFMATFDAVQRASAAGANFVITHEPTFYSHLDTTDALQQDPVYRAKTAFVDEHRMAIFRFHDHWHARRPDGMRLALLRAFDWPDGPNPVMLPSPTTLEALAADIQRRLEVRALRVVGEPSTPVSRVALSIGYGNPQLTADVDVAITGESQEADSAWDNAGYAADSAAVARPKGLILLGHEQSEGRGMDVCAAWLRTFITEVPVTFVRSGEPFWVP